MESIRKLISNPKNISIETINILLQIGSNIVKNPSEEKYRKLRTSNKKIKDKILLVPGGIQCLIEMGFKKIGEELIFPSNGDLVTLKRVLTNLENARKSVNTQRNDYVRIKFFEEIKYQ